MFFIITFLLHKNHWTGFKGAIFLQIAFKYLNCLISQFAQKDLVDPEEGDINEEIGVEFEQGDA